MEAIMNWFENRVSDWLSPTIAFVPEKIVVSIAVGPQRETNVEEFVGRTEWCSSSGSRERKMKNKDEKLVSCRPCAFKRHRKGNPNALLSLLLLLATPFSRLDSASTEMFTFRVTLHFSKSHYHHHHTSFLFNSFQFFLPFLLLYSFENQ